MEDDGVGKRLRGTVKWFNAFKGYGFITPDGEFDDQGEDLFVHQTSIISEGFRTLYDSQRVDFVVQVDDDGRSRAVDVVPLRGSRRSGGGYGRSMVAECFNCGKTGHMARDCYYLDNGNGGVGGGYSGQGRGGGGGYYRRGGGRRGGRESGYGGGESVVICYGCGEKGHFARDCPDAVHN